MDRLIYKDYFIKNTVSEWQSSITSRALTKKKILEKLKDSYDWYKSQPSGKVYKRLIFLKQDGTIFEKEVLIKEV